MTQRGASSKRYARAVVDAARRDGADGPQRVAAEIEAFASAYASSTDLVNVLANPVFTQEERMATLDAVVARLGLSATSKRLLGLLVERGRIAELPAIAEEVRSLADGLQRRVRAKVETSSQLPDDALENIRRALERRTGRAVELDVSVNPWLLGGVRAQVGSTVFDGTIRSQLEALREALTHADT